MVEVCNNCKGADFVEDWSRGDTICRNCGYVQDKLICEEFESRIFSDTQHTAVTPRTETSSVLMSGPSTYIDTNGKRNSSRPVVNPIDECLLQAVSLLHNLPLEFTEDIQQHTLEILKKVLLKKIRARLELKVAACLFVVCRKHSVSRTHREIAQIFAIPKEKFTSCLKLVVNTLELDLAPPRVEELVDRACFDVRITTEDHLNRCRSTAKRLNEQQQGRNPNSIVAASLWIVSRQVMPTLTLPEICKCTNISARTVLMVSKKYTQNTKGGNSAKQEESFVLFLTEMHHKWLFVIIDTFVFSVCFTICLRVV
eukprot:c10096_g1_i2.p1 GENE.c10096_g1_i2~~c10096_g1_i2.p1  ORF type:complete len:326 (-),score=78.14 c10096_g1_i2:98-1033(-)